MPRAVGTIPVNCYNTTPISNILLNLWILPGKPEVYTLPHKTLSGSALVPQPFSSSRRRRNSRTPRFSSSPVSTFSETSENAFDERLVTYRPEDARRRLAACCPRTDREKAHPCTCQSPEHRASRNLEYFEFTNGEHVIESV